MNFASTSANSRLDRLLTYISADPQNLALLGDAAECALSEHRPEIALQLLERYVAIESLPPALENAVGVAALQLGDYARAADTFERLLDTSPNDPALRFNLAWAFAGMKAFDRTLTLLDETTVSALPQAAMLHVQVLHSLEKIEDAEAAARRAIALHPDHQGLAAAVSTLAIDISDFELARACARNGGDHPDALTTLGTLALDEGDRDQAHTLFERALKHNPHAARAWIGKGLSTLASGQAASDAASDMQRGAEIFGGHIGSWIATGWAHLLAGDQANARSCFDKALAIDANFAETHGSLAVLAILENRIEDARHLSKVALRLDVHSFAGALARALLLNTAGKPALAQAIIDRAMKTAIDESGTTLAQALTKHGLSAR